MKVKTFFNEYSGDTVKEYKEWIQAQTNIIIISTVSLENTLIVTYRDYGSLAS